MQTLTGLTTENYLGLQAEAGIISVGKKIVVSCVCQLLFGGNAWKSRLGTGTSTV